MKKIKTLSDLERLKGEGLLSPSLLSHLEEYFLSLYGELSEDELIEEFSLEEHGYLVVLEQHEDDIRDLSSVGLNPKTGGLIGSWPEWVELKEIGNESYYQICIMFDNEYVMIFYSKQGQLDSEAEAWLQEQAGIG